MTLPGLQQRSQERKFSPRRESMKETAYEFA